MEEYHQGLIRAYEEGLIRVEGGRDLFAYSDLKAFAHYDPEDSLPDLCASNTRPLLPLVEILGRFFKGKSCAVLELGAGAGVASYTLFEQFERQGTHLSLSTYGRTPINPYFGFLWMKEWKSHAGRQKNPYYSRFLCNQIHKMVPSRAGQDSLALPPSGNLRFQEIFRYEHELGIPLLERRERPFIQTQWIGEFHPDVETLSHPYDLVFEQMGPLRYIKPLNREAAFERVYKSLDSSGMAVFKEADFPEGMVSRNDFYAAIRGHGVLLIREGHPLALRLHRTYPKNLPCPPAFLSQLRECVDQSC